jgi:hypothetical protein
MLEIDMGVQGAKRTRYYPKSPDAVLRRLVEKHPNATEAELEDAFEEKVLKLGGSILSSIIAYWFANRYRALVRELTPIAVVRSRKAAKEARIKDEVEVVKRAAIAKIGRTLLDKIAPGCGKKLSDMTKRDCEREGGAFVTLAAKLKPGQTVKQAKISNDQLWDLYNSQ